MSQDKIRLILNTVFMIGAVASIIIYFAFPEERTLFFYVILTSLAIKIIEFFIRFMF